MDGAIGKLDAILKAVQLAYRQRIFPIPAGLVPSLQEIAVKPVEERQALKERRLELRREIDLAVVGYRTRDDLDRLPWAEIAKHGRAIERHAQAFRKLIDKDDTAGKWWARELSGLAVALEWVEAMVSHHLDSPEVERDSDQSARAWFVERLAHVFGKYFEGREEPFAVRDMKISRDDQGFYGPFVAFVLAVSKEAKIKKIRPATIYRIVQGK
ncbi:hypothetical protein [Sinorhizobium chiapasense]|uniref:Uncharacterized protein n=1 Tax=Sinorhizobium chiapasense TaxID=501572 RepID=A0ABZ2BC27_9HYPH